MKGLLGIVLAAPILGTAAGHTLRIMSHMNRANYVPAPPMEMPPDFKFIAMAPKTSLLEKRTLDKLWKRMRTCTATRGTNIIVEKLCTSRDLIPSGCTSITIIEAFGPTEKSIT